MAQTGKWLCALIIMGGCAQARRPDASKTLQDMNANLSKKKVLLGWEDKIDSQKFGLAPNKNIDGKTLAEVISSQAAGRDDAQLCSACHNSSDAQGGYAVPVAKNSAATNLTPTDTVNNRTWVGKDGWAERFIKNPTKPNNLKIFIQAWIDNGYK